MAKSEQLLHSPDHVRATVASRLAQFAFLNDPPSVDGDLFAHPILEKLCRSFYEEEKWKQALKQSNPSEDSEWLASVTVVMVAFAATAYQAALEEWQSGNYVQRKFDCLKTLPAYTEIHDHIVDRLENDPYSGDASDRFSSWACESDFVQVVLDGLGVPPADDD